MRSGEQQHREWMRCFALSACLALAMTATCRAAANITPYHAQVRFARASAEASSGASCHPNPVWTDVVRNKSGKSIYTFTLEPMCTAGGYVIGMELVLKDNGKPKEYNLLCPDDICMGLQAFDFNGVDFVHGPEKSIFGATRTIRVPGRYIVVTVKVVRAGVSPIAGSTYSRLDNLDLDLSMEDHE